MENFYTLSESAGRYSVEVNYKTDLDEVINNWAKLVLGYVSAALKKDNYSVKRLFSDHEKPYRIFVSPVRNEGNFKDGDWVAVVIHNPKENCFIIGQGFFQGSTKQVVITKHEKCESKSASELYKNLKSFMKTIEDKPPRNTKLNSANLKTGPKQGSMRPAQGAMRAGQGLQNKDNKDVIS